MLRPVLMAALVVAPVGCDDSPAATSVEAVTPPASPTQSPRSTDEAVKAEILAQYREYHATVQSAESATPEERRRILEPYLTEPALSRHLRGMAALQRAGRKTYGAPIIHVTNLTVASDRAVIHDCQDQTGFGQMHIGTGEILTSGVADLELTVTMRRVDDEWKIADLVESNDPC